MKKFLHESIQQAVQKTWADAVASILGLEKEMSRRFRHVRERADLHQAGEEFQRTVAELGKKMQQSSEAFEKKLEETVRNVMARVGGPMTEELATLRSRAEKVSGRVELLLRRNAKAADRNVKSPGGDGDDTTTAEKDLNEPA